MYLDPAEPRTALTRIGPRGAPRGKPVASGSQGAIARVRTVATGAWAGLRRLPKAAQLGVAGAMAVVIILAIVLIGSGGGDSGTKKPTVAAPTGHAPAFPVQPFHDSRGITLDVPSGWKQQKVSSYINFTDPANADRRIRINVETSGKNTAKQFLDIAEHGLKTRGSCPDYQRVAVADITLDGRSAAQLEYTCGSGDTMRHGEWAVTTQSGHAYHFYLTVPEADFATSHNVFDEMVTSFRLAVPKN